jgi:hypothetical protein
MQEPARNKDFGRLVFFVDPERAALTRAAQFGAHPGRWAMPEAIIFYTYVAILVFVTLWLYENLQHRHD